MKRFGAVLVLLALCASSIASARDVMLTWTATGDDGGVGKATSYELRYKSVAIAGVDTLSWWNTSGVISTGPPSLAGATDSAIVAGLDTTRTWYFMIRAVDDVGNRAGFSNLAVVPPPRDTIPPAPIRSLNGRWR